MLLLVHARRRPLLGICLFWLTSLLSTAAFAEPPSVDAKPDDEPQAVDLATLLGSEESCNAVDLWLVEIARSDGHPRTLDDHDFLRAVGPATVKKFLYAADRYVNERWIRCDRSDWVVTEFLDTLGELHLPAYYTVFLLHGHSDIGRLRRGHTTAYVPYRWHFATNRIQGHDVTWNPSGVGIGVGVSWPWLADPYQVKWPLGWLGVGMRALRGSGSIRDKDQVLGTTDLFELAFLVQGSMRYTLSPMWTLHLDGATGFSLGTLRVLRAVNDGGLTDPCAVDPSRGLDLNAAGVAVRCAVNNSFGFYHAFPLEIGAGVLMWEWLDLSFNYGYASMVTDRSQFSPGGLHSFTLGLGIVIH